MRLADNPKWAHLLDREVPPIGKTPMHRFLFGLTILATAIPAVAQTPAAKKPDKTKPAVTKDRDSSAIAFSIHSVRSGPWSDPKTWQPTRLPGKDDRVRLSRGTRVVYDVESKDVIRLLQVVG